MAYKVKFAENYDHKWPSKAVTAFKKGWSGTVKDEVAKGAKRLGVLDGEPEKTGPKAGNTDAGKK